MFNSSDSYQVLFTTFHFLSRQTVGYLPTTCVTCCHVTCSGQEHEETDHLREALDSQKAIQHFLLSPEQWYSNTWSADMEQGLQATQEEQIQWPDDMLIFRSCLLPLHNPCSIPVCLALFQLCQSLQSPQPCPLKKWHFCTYKCQWNKSPYLSTSICWTPTTWEQSNKRNKRTKIYSGSN